MSKAALHSVQPRFSFAWICFAVSLSLTPESIAAKDKTAWVLHVIETLCPQPVLSGWEAQLALPGAWLLEETHWPNSAAPQRSVVRLAAPGSGEVRIERRAQAATLRQFRVAYFGVDDGELQPQLQAIADGGCVVRSGRKIRQGAGAWRYLDQLDADLETLRWTETLQAPWPQEADPGGVRVAVVDSGLAYDLPIFQNRLARGADGAHLGYDFWDQDPWPYDGDVSRGAFFPIRHGTSVASILVREAPDAVLVPFRYPRPDMRRMADVVVAAHAAGSRIIAMPLGSSRRDDWLAFEGALREFDVLAIVSAGNDGKDIDLQPVYPAALDAPNLITVTSADSFGRLAEGSNWGENSVDIMLPAENIDVIDFRGASGVASGSSYAVPRLAAMAARILAASPELTIAELKQRILDRAVASPFERDGVLNTGWIADPLAD